ncbi:hypothetical protein BHM03_00042803 [Ensete ventricosum]|nr:hypothetical protein BHM03_00042803 [Ensete ventricosum]
MNLKFQSCLQDLKLYQVEQELVEWELVESEMEQKNPILVLKLREEDGSNKTKRIVLALKLMRLEFQDKDSKMEQDLLLKKESRQVLLLQAEWEIQFIACDYDFRPPSNNVARRQATTDNLPRHIEASKGGLTASKGQAHSRTTGTKQVKKLVKQGINQGQKQSDEVSRHCPAPPRAGKCSVGVHLYKSSSGARKERKGQLLRLCLRLLLGTLSALEMHFVLEGSGSIADSPDGSVDERELSPGFHILFRGTLMVPEANKLWQ